MEQYEKAEEEQDGGSDELLTLLPANAALAIQAPTLSLSRTLGVTLQYLYHEH